MSKLSSLFMSNEKGSGDQKVEHASDSPKVPYRILFVDDEENVLRAMRRIFRQENYVILTAPSGDEALKILQGAPVHVVVTDHRMPGLTGAELLRKLKSLYPQTIRIMLTGYADVDAIMGAVNEGAVYKFITKPWNDQDLRLTVSLALEQYDLRQENETLKKQQVVQKETIQQLSKFVNQNRSQLGRLLLKKNLIKKEDLSKALALQTSSKRVLPSILMEMGLEEETILKTIETEMGIHRVYPNEFNVPSVLASLIPREMCEKNVLVPLKRDEGGLMVAMADPTDFLKTDDLRFITGLPIQAVLSTQKEILDKLEELYGGNESLESAICEFQMDPSENIEIIIEEEDEELAVEELLKKKDLPPAVRIVNAIISDALRHGASDVHIEPKTKHAMVRYRVDGLLEDKMHIPLSMHAPIVSRIKIMSDLDIAERRKPQDGRVTVKTSSRMVDMRISTLPTISGEKVVLRILDKNAAIKDLQELGFSDRDFEKISRFIECPQGILLSTGPTGSGKTSTLYSLLQKGATITKNFTTIEDPVEYFMGMAEQVSVRNKIGLLFPMVLRAILRQDPNVIMLGEIRDFETAEVAFHAALTGHLVLSTLHTNGTVASITRLRDMGIKPYVISDALIGLVAQRLVRRICTNCKTDDSPPDHMLRVLKIDKRTQNFHPKIGKGCDQCNHTGYKGRVGIFEVFQMDGELKKMIHREATETELMRAAKVEGMTTLLEDAIQKIADGHTSCEEVLRVLGPQNSMEILCPGCAAFLEERYSFCPHCGVAMGSRCSHCGNLLDKQWKVCPSCGETLPSSRETLPSSRETLPSSRETLPQSSQPCLSHD